jgi:hypothetical protein
MKNLILTLTLPFISAQSFASSPADSVGDGLARLLFQQKVNAVYRNALACNPLEVDLKSGLNVTDWKKMQPPIPHWWRLRDLQTTANAAKKYAIENGGTDKVLHCFAGCFIAKKQDYTSAVMVGWLKELTDASDCSEKTHFEKNDYEATIAGAHIGIRQVSCESFCAREDIKDLDGDEMLEAAQREP